MTNSKRNRRQARVAISSTTRTAKTKAVAKPELKTAEPTTKVATYYMAVTGRNATIVSKKTKQLPVFWSSRKATEAANQLNGKKVKVTLNW